jgi:hypothetical protein
MNEHRFDRWARALAERDEAISRRRFLVYGAAAGASTLVPLRLAGTAQAESISSCDCSGYADRVYVDCWTEVVDGAGPFNGDSGWVEAMQFGISSQGARLICLPKADKAQKDCQTTPCPAGETCTPQHDAPPACIGACNPRCEHDQYCCGHTCVSLDTDGRNCGACGHVCLGNSTCKGGQCVPSDCNPVCQKPGICCGQDGGWICTDPSSDRNNCGGCGNKCSSSTTCCKGTCMSPALAGRVCGEASG